MRYLNKASFEIEQYMSIAEYFEKYRNIQGAIILFIEDEKKSDKNYQNLSYFIDKYKICSDKNDITLFLYLISNILQNYHPISNFISKIERILKNYEKDIKKNL